MFTGIIETTGTITGVEAAPGGKRLRIDVGPIAGECSMGASVCVSGVCLTVAGVYKGELAFDVISETLRSSTLGRKKVGDRVNLERSLKVGDRLDGHFVGGHVDATAIVTRVTARADECVVWLRPETDVGPYIVPKGSIAVDGISLTVASVVGEEFSVALIPTTLELTTISTLEVGDRVNLETDVIARAVAHQLSRISKDGGVTMETLREAGFA